MSTEVNLASRGGPWKRLFDTNLPAATAAFTSGGLAARPGATPFVATAALAIIALNDIPVSEKPALATGESEPNSVAFRFFGNNANNCSFSARIYGITAGGGTVGTTKTQSWEATLLAELLVTFGNINGIAGTLIPAADFEADTIAITSGNTNYIQLLNTTDVKQAWAQIDHLAFPALAVELDDAVNSGTPATACNALYRFLW